MRQFMSAVLSSAKASTDAWRNFWQEKLTGFRLFQLASDRFQIVTGLSVLLGTAVLLAIFINLVSDRRSSQLASRVELAEAVATMGAVLLHNGDTSGFRYSLEFLVENNPAIHAIRLQRSSGGELVFPTDRDWQTKQSELNPVVTHDVRVPLLESQQQWGELVVQYASIENQHWLIRYAESRWALIIFITLLCFSLFYRFVKQLVKELNPFDALLSQDRFSLDPPSVEKIDEPHDSVAKTKRSRILVVDNGLENRQLLSMVLGDLNLDVVLAENGRQAIDLLFDDRENGRIDLVFMEIQMPVMDGYAAIAEMRHRGATLPIVALTASALNGFERQVIDAGFSNYIVKPIDLDEMCTLLAELLAGEQGFSTAKSEDGVLAQLPHHSADASSICLEPVFSNLPMQQFEFYGVVESFIKRLQSQLDALQVAAGQADGKRVEEIAFWLRGSGGNVGYSGFAKICNQLEDKARVDVSHISAEVGAVEHYVERVLMGWKITSDHHEQSMQPG